MKIFNPEWYYLFITVTVTIDQGFTSAKLVIKFILKCIRWEQSCYGSTKSKRYISQEKRITLNQKYCIFSGATEILFD